MSLKKQRQRERARELIAEMPGPTSEDIEQKSRFKEYYDPKTFTEQLERLQLSPLLIPVYEKHYREAIEKVYGILDVK